MDTKIIDEREMVAKFKENNLEGFYSFVQSYDKYIANSMRAKGYKLVNAAERTVVFTFGEVTFSRNRWYKNGKCKIPVDDKLGLEKNSRYSLELIYQIANLAAMLPYRQVIEVIKMMYQIYISKDTVVKAIKMSASILNEKEEYRFFKMENTEQKIKADKIFIEGDGVFFNVNEDGIDQSKMEISHFVIHTGKKKLHGERFVLQNKREVIEKSSYLAREKVLDILENEFEITDETIFITNSDGGKGYTPYVFQELVKSFPHKKHEHFWDRYHINKELGLMFANYPKQLFQDAMKAINTHSRKGMVTILDTFESMITTEYEQGRFESLKRRMLSNFQYTKTPEYRGYTDLALGITESQHRKLTFRMKNRGMNWTQTGALTVAKIIILKDENKLRDLFFGSWREEYKKFEELNLSAGYVSDQSARKYDLSVPSNKITKNFSKL